MIHIEPIRPQQGEVCGVAEVNDKIFTYKDHQLYGVPDGDLTDSEETAINNWLRAIKSNAE